MSQIIIWATDGSSVAEDALPMAKRLATTFEAKLVAVHVNQTVVVQGARHPVIVDEPDIRARVRRAVRSMRAHGIDAELRIVGPTPDGPAQGIAEFAAAVRADVIVLGTQRRPAFSAVLHGSVAPRLLGRAPCPVVVVPPPCDGS